MLTAMDTEAIKRLVARAALDLLPESGVVGLGTGSTAKYFVEGVGELVAEGRQFKAVPTSDQSRAQALSLGIELLPDSGPWQIDVCVDGADEVSADLDLIKGGGGCHTREKIVNRASALNVIVVDESKLSQRLGQTWAVPVEVLAFGHESTRRLLERFGSVTLRHKQDEPWITDSHNFIYDVRTDPIAAPAELERDLACVPGVVETGLFVARADVVLVGTAQGVRRIDRPGANSMSTPAE